MPIDARVGELLNDISSKSPTPGGGSVAALSGSLGAALVSMVCRLSIGRKKYEIVEDELNRVLSEAEVLRQELSNLFWEDIDAFKEVMSALKMPKEEGQNRVQIAYEKAISVPLDVAERCLKIIELAEVAASKGNKNAVTDSGVGALMAYSGLKGAALNVKVNLKSIENQDFFHESWNKIEELEKRGGMILEDMMKAIELVISPS